MEPLKCTYCGDENDIIREHVIPASYFGRRTFDNHQQWIIPACQLCNSLAGSAVFFSIPEKANYIAKRYRGRYAKILRMPPWSPDEIKRMKYRLRVGLEQKLLAKAIAQRKLLYVEAVGDYPQNFLRPAWVEREQRIWWERQKERVAWEKKHRKEQYGKKSAEQIK